LATIATTTITNPFQYPGNRLLARFTSSAKYHCLVRATTANNYVLYRSTDGGSSWAPYLTHVRANIVDVGSITLDPNGNTWWTYRVNESSLDKIYIVRFDWNSYITAEVLLGSAGNGGVAGAVYSGLDVISQYVSNGAYIVVAAGTQIGGTQGVTLFGTFSDSSGVVFANNSIISGTRQWLYTAAAGRSGPQIDKEHNGNGFDASSPNLWVSFMRSDLRLVKLAWNGSNWVGPSSATLITSGMTARDTSPSLWDGTRFIMVAPDPISTDVVMLIERNKSNSTTTTRRSTSHPTGVIRQATMAYDATSNDVRVYAIGTSTAVLYFCDYIRATDTWTAWTSAALTIIGANVDNFGAKMSSYGDARHGLYTATGTTPFTLTYTPQTLTYNPNTPTWASPTNGAAGDVAASLVLDWNFTDPDPGDSQARFALSRQVGTGTLEYWRTSDNTWQLTEQQNTSGTTALTLTATQWSLDGLANGAADPIHTYKVKVWDQALNTSAYSAGLGVLPSSIVNPAITAPTVAQVITTDHVTITWTAAEQTQYRIRLNVQAGAQVYDSGWINDSATRSVLVAYLLPNSTAWTLTLNTRNLEGLPSADQTRDFSVSFTPPATPTLIVAPLRDAGVIRTKITNPSPTGTQPAVVDQELWRRVVGTVDVVRMAAALASNTVYDDWQAVSGVIYEYQATTRGNNGTSISGAWTQ
jgi:hypothetical protein